MYASSTYFLNCTRTSGGSIDGSVKIQVDVPAGHLKVDRRVIASGVAAWAKVFANLDGDGKLDVIVSGGPTLGRRIVWYSSSSDYRSSHELAPTGGGEDLAVADIDGDGLADVIGAGIKDDPVGNVVGHNKIVWLRNPGAAGATGRWAETVVQSNFVAHELLVADFNGDGKTDILAQESSTEEIVVFLQGSTPASWTRVTLLAAPLGIAVARVNGDAYPDVVGHGFWLRNPGPGGGAWARFDFDTTLQGGIGQGGSTIVADNLDGVTGQLDVVLAPSELSNNARGPLARYRLAPGANPELASGWEKTILVSDALNVHMMRVADMDKNGRKDVVFAEMHTTGIAPLRLGILLNQGPGAGFIAQTVHGAGSHNLALGDADGDGWIDIVGSNQEVDAADRGALSIWYGGRN